MSDVMLRRLRRAREAENAYAHAIGLSEDSAVRDFLVLQSRDAW